MIEVKHLVKKFGETRAVDDVSFTIERGEIVGLLGPNGAGKTTTMRMVTTYLAPDSGDAGFITNLSATAGRVMLVTGTTPITCGGADSGINSGPFISATVRQR